MTTRPQTHLYTHLVSFSGWFKYTHKQTHMGVVLHGCEVKLATDWCPWAASLGHTLFISFPFTLAVPSCFDFLIFFFVTSFFPFLLYCFLVLFIYLFFAIAFPILIPLCGSLSLSILFWDIDRVVVLLLCVGCAFLLSVALTAPPFYRGSRYPLQTVAWQW